MAVKNVGYFTSVYRVLTSKLDKQHHHSILSSADYINALCGFMWVEQDQPQKCMANGY